MPGCGLGRLVFEFAKRGFKAQGNEFAYFCLLSSNFILNASDQPNQFTIYPYIHCFSNARSDQDIYKAVQIPDVCPNIEMSDSEGSYDFSMVAGEFNEVYGGQTSEWDSIVTCFFIDTAHNIMDYLVTLNKILKIGGLWANIGPLQWHYSENFYETQVELAWDEIAKIIP